MRHKIKDLAFSCRNMRQICFYWAFSFLRLHKINIKMLEVLYPNNNTSYNSCVGGGCVISPFSSPTKALTSVNIKCRFSLGHNNISVKII